MTFEQMVDRVADRLNLTATDALERIGEEINDRYAQITTSIGLQTSRREETSAPTVVDSQTVTFSDCEKVFLVYKLVGARKYFLDELTPDEMSAITAVDSDSVRQYAITRMDADSVTITLDVIPETVFTLYAEVLTDHVELEGGDVPVFPESFHDALVWGALSEEYRRMEKDRFFKDAELKFEQRVSDLRMFIAKSGYLDIIQSKTPSRRWLR